MKLSASKVKIRVKKTTKTTIWNFMVEIGARDIKRHFSRRTFTLVQFADSNIKIR
jgi:hypothetical protein